MPYHKVIFKNTINPDDAYLKGNSRHDRVNVILPINSGGPEGTYRCIHTPLFDNGTARTVRIRSKHPLILTRNQQHKLSGQTTYAQAIFVLRFYLEPRH